MPSASHDPSGSSAGIGTKLRGECSFYTAYPPFRMHYGTRRAKCQTCELFLCVHCPVNTGGLYVSKYVRDGE
jgi:hypothetical protein